MATQFKTGERVLFQSPEFPQLAPCPVTIHAVNYSIAGSAAPYYMYKTDQGDISQWYYHTCFLPLAVDGLTPEQVEEMQRLKQFYPFRIIWGEVVDGKFSAYASTNRRGMNKSARAGNKVYTLA